MPRPTATGRRNAPRVQKAIKAVQTFYAAGSRSLKKYPDRMAYGQSATEAGEAGMNVETFRKARAFADGENGGYSGRELEQLIQLMQEQDAPIDPKHIKRLLTVKDKRRRASLQRAVALHRWSCHELDAELHRLFGSRRRSTGRKPRVPRTPGGVRYELLRLTLGLRRFIDMIQLPGVEGKGTLAAELTAKERSLLGQLSPAVRRLERRLAEKFPSADHNDIAP